MSDASRLRFPRNSPSPSTAGRLIDPRGHRFGAAVSVVILLASFALGAPLLVAAVALALGVSAALGTRYSVLGRPWPLVRRALGIGPAEEIESEYPPRFAQALGAIGLAIAGLLFAIGATPWAWLPVAGVGTLQTLLAVTGYCVGCRLYFLRWWIPALFDRLVGRPGPRLSS